MFILPVARGDVATRITSRSLALSVSSPEEGIVATSSCQHMHVLFPPVVESPAEIKRQRVRTRFKRPKVSLGTNVFIRADTNVEFSLLLCRTRDMLRRSPSFRALILGVLCNAYILVQQCIPVQECCTDERGKHARCCCAGGLIAHCSLGRTDTGYILPLLAYDITAQQETLESYNVKCFPPKALHDPPASSTFTTGDTYTCLLSRRCRQRRRRHERPGPAPQPPFPSQP